MRKRNTLKIIIWIFCTVTALPLTSFHCLGQQRASRIQPGLWRAVVRIVAEGSTNNPARVGTGFVVSKDIIRPGGTNSVRFLITNKHMISDWKAVDGNISEYDPSILVFFYSEDGKPLRLNVGNASERQKRYILPHPNPNVDVAALVLLDEWSGVKADSFDVSMLPSFSETNSFYSLGMGDQVYALGYPHGIVAQRNNYPVAKTGWLSSVPGEELNLRVPATNRFGVLTNVTIAGKIFVVDGLLVPGNSGGPVIMPSTLDFATDEKGKFFYSARPKSNRVIGVMSMSSLQAGLSFVFSSDYVLDLITKFDDWISDINGDRLITK